VTGVSGAEGLRKPSVSRILRLALGIPASGSYLGCLTLTRGIVEAILAGRTDTALMLESLERPLPVSWEEQRRLSACTS
jgi:hypothetical protein